MNETPCFTPIRVGDYVCIVSKPWAMDQGGTPARVVSFTEPDCYTVEIPVRSASGKLNRRLVGRGSLALLKTVRVDEVAAMFAEVER